MDALEAGEAALARGEWEEARHAFEQAVADQPSSAEAQECLGRTAWLLDDAETVFAAREEAYRLDREAGDAQSAARVAGWLAWDASAFREAGRA